MDHAIDIVLNLNKARLAGHVANLALDARALGKRSLITSTVRLGLAQSACGRPY